MEKLKNPIATWDLTVSFEGTNYTRDSLAEIFVKKFKKWCFQLELSEKGYKHWQCRISTFKKSRSAPNMDGVHPKAWSATSLENQNNDFYVMKEETRLEGPWKNTDEIIVETEQMKGFKTSKWMDHLIAEAKIFDMRQIDIIYDPIGNRGKSLFTEYIESIGLAEEIPPFRNMEDIFQWVHGRPKKSAYIVDMPRGLKKDKMAEFYSGIEVIKNGIAYDKRHFPKKSRFNRPRVFVFTNTLPCFDLLSIDRWKVWAIMSRDDKYNNELVEVLDYNVLVPSDDDDNSS